MNARELPEVYRGFSTADLLDIWEKVSGGGLRKSMNLPPEKMLAMRGLVKEYKLSPESRFAEKLAKKTMEMAR